MRNKVSDTSNKILHKILLKLISSHRGKAHAEFNKVGLTQGQPKILDFLSENAGCIQREISEYCMVKPATVTSLLVNMEKSGLVFRTEDPQNKRILNVFLTDKGIKSQKEVEKIFYSIDAQCFQGFSEKEKIQTIEFMNRMDENLLEEEEIND